MVLQVLLAKNTTPRTPQHFLNISFFKQQRKVNQTSSLLQIKLNF